MDKSESLAKRYLESLNLGHIAFEPDGNVPPDFLVNGRIAIEVRRLNQNFESEDGTSRGLEQTEIPLRQRMRKYLRDFAASRDGESWFVGYGFRRPLEPWSTVEPLLRDALREFMMSPVRQRKKLRLTKHFDIDFFEAGVTFDSFFVLGATSDDQSGGWVMYELQKNLLFCIAEKERKIEIVRHKYPEWCLILDDRIDYGIELQDRHLFESEVLPSLQHSFARLVLLDPRERNPPLVA
jgi:hypothetical protein